MSKGKLLSDCSKYEIHKAMPSIIKALDAIRAIDISVHKGFGPLDFRGKADFNSHKEVLLDVVNQTLKDCERDLNCRFLEIDIIKKFLDEYKVLIDFCPEVRCLVHGDFGHNNATVDNSQLTGVFDWEHSSYGDFLHDVAWLDFWAEDMGFKEALFKHYMSNDIEVSNFEERILCYQLGFGIGGMMFFAAWMS